MRVFTQSNEPKAIRNIASIVCNEFGFKGVSSVTAVNPNFKQFSTDADYLNFANYQSVSGLQCSGQELTLKDCFAEANVTLATKLFELDIECYCKFISNF
jgi:hypothetical protein